MAFPALTPISAPPDNVGSLWAEGTGVPTNGVQTIDTGLAVDPESVDPAWVAVEVFALGPGVTGFTFLSCAPDLSTVTLSIGQTGADSAKIRVHLEHSVIR